MLYPYTALATCLSLWIYFVVTAYVGQARGKFQIKAPAVTGHPQFERIFRVQQNTLEALVWHMPALWLFAGYLSDRWAAAIGLVWCVGRVLYAKGYYAEAAKRGTGVMVSNLATIALLLGASAAVALRLIRG